MGIRNSGTALVWAMLFVVVTSGMILSHTAFLSANRCEMDARYGQGNDPDKVAAPNGKVGGTNVEIRARVTKQLARYRASRIKR